jgi:hypothetical protein
MEKSEIMLEPGAAVNRHRRISACARRMRCGFRIAGFRFGLVVAAA